MPEVKLSYCKIKTGRVEELRNWYEELEKRSNEVIKTLKHENMLTETAFILQESDEKYLYVFMESEDLEEAENSGNKEKFDIDEEHHEVLENCLTGEWKTLESIGHMTNPDR